MKSKITKIQILMKGMAMILACMFMLTPIAYATTSLDDGYLEGSLLDKLLYGKIGSTAKEIEEYFNSGETTLYIINETQLRALAEYVNNGNTCKEKEIILLNDIEIDSSVEWVPIGKDGSHRFYGTFDGRGHTISGLNYTRGNKNYSDITYIGLFGVIGSSSTIKNLITEDFYINLRYEDGEFENGKAPYTAAGNIVGYCYGTIENCVNKSDIYGGKDVGGIVGKIYNGKITNCYNSGSVDGYSCVGGIAGFVHGKNTEITVKSCVNTGVINGNTNVGGIVGYVYSKSEKEALKVLFEYCANQALIRGYNNIGGIIGYGIESLIGDIQVNYCYSIECIDSTLKDINTYEIIGVNNAGGIIGSLVGTIKDDLKRELNISKCVVTQEVIVIDSCAGGIAGNISNAQIRECVSAAAVSTDFSNINTETFAYSNVNNPVVNFINKVDSFVVGGIVGYAEDSMIKNCGVGNRLIAYDKVGGIAGETKNTTIEDYQKIILLEIGQEEDRGQKAIIRNVKNDQMTTITETGEVAESVFPMVGSNISQHVLPEKYEAIFDPIDISGAELSTSAAIGNNSSRTYAIEMTIDGVKHILGSTLGNEDTGIKQTVDTNADVTVTYEIYKNGNKVNGNQYFKENDVIKVKATFNKYLATSYGPLVKIAVAPTLKLNDSIEMTAGTVNADSSNYTTTIEYTYIVKEGDNFEITSLNLLRNGTVYAVEADDYDKENKVYLRPSTVSTSKVSTTISNITVDTTEPIINTKVYVENALETGRYTAGKEIIFEVTTSERIDGKYTVPEIQVSFSKSEIGKYNYNKEENKVGCAKCVDSKINIDGTTTWLFSYQVQEFDEGELEFTFTAGKIKDLAGNVTNIKDLYTPTTNITSEVIKGTEWGNDLGVTYEFYKNSVSNANKVTSQTYFTNTDDLVVVATYDKVLYTLFGKINNGDHSEPFSSKYKAHAPSIYLNSEVNLKSGTAENVSIINNNTNTKIQYRFTDIAKEYGLTTLTKISNISSKNDNNYQKTIGQVTLDGKIGYSENYYTEYSDENAKNVKYLNNNATIKTEGLDDIIIDPIGVSTKIEKSDIYADTTAPTLTITADKPNPTNADEIIYTFEFSEKVEGFTPDDITVNNADKNTKEETIDGETKKVPDFVEVTEGLKYTLKVKPTITEGNEGIVQVIVEEGAVKDLVAINNVRQENNITIDKKAPTVQIQADKDYVKADEVITYTFTWSEEILTTEKIGIDVINGEIVNPLTKINEYQGTMGVKPTNGNDVEVKVSTGTVKDIAGNENDVEATHIITVIPTVTITTNATSNPTNVNEIIYTFTWSEEVVGFDEKDIILPEGITGTFDPKTNKMVVNYNSLIPNGNEGEVTVSVVEKAVKDSNGNENAYTTNTLKIDRIAPIFVGLEAHVDSKIGLNAEVDTVKEYYKAGDKVVITATFTENITNSTAPVLALKFSESGNPKGSIAEPELKGNQIIYTYIIKDGDMGTLSVRGFSGEVQDAAGNKTTVGKKSLDGNTIIADTDAPSLKELNIISPVTGTYKAETPIEIHAIYDENVYALENNEIKNITSETAPTLKIKFADGEEREATFESYVGEDKTKLKYTISILDGENGLLSITSYENKENVKVCDIAGNDSSLGLNPTGNEITADTIKPQVESITAVVENPTILGTDIYHKAENKIKITVTFTEEVSSAVLFPQILIGFSEEEGVEPKEYNNYAYESDWNVNSKTIEYTYTIREGNNGYLWVKVPEGQFKDIAGNKNIASNAEEKLNVFADTIIPTVTLYRDTEETQNNQIITIKARFNENVYDLNGNRRVTLTKANAPKLIYSFGTGENREIGATLIEGNTITYTITKNAVDDNGDLHYELAKGNLCDRAGNELYKTTLDTTAPVLESVIITSNAGIYTPYCKEGKEIYVIATFNELIKAENMKLKAKVGEVELAELLDGEIVKENETMIKFTYTVKAGDMGEFKILDICGETDSKITEENADKTYGWAQDAYGNQNNIYNLVDEKVTTTGSAIADTKDPYITSIKATADGEVIATYTKEEGKDPVVSVGRTNADIVEYIVTYSEKVPYSHFEKISIYNATIKDIQYTDKIALNEYKITVKTTYEGVQSLIINEGTVEDKAGNIDNFVRLNAVTIDFTDPTVRFISEYNGGTYVLPTNIGKVEIRPNVEISEDIASIEYKWDDGEYVEIENYSSSSDIAVPTKTFTEAGTHALYIRVVDLAGNDYETSKTYEILNSNIDIELNTYEYTNEDITVTVSFGEGLTDNRKVTFKAENSNDIVELNAIGTNENGHTQYSITENGTIYAEATDRVENKVFTEYRITNIDKENPEITIELNGANLVIGTGEDKAVIKTNVETKDNNWVEEAKYIFLTEDIDINNMTTEQKAKISNKLENEAKIENAVSGKYYLYVLAKDKAGNETIVKSNAFTVVDTNEDTITNDAGEETTVPAEKPVSELIIFEQMEEDIKDRAYVYVNHDYAIIKDLDITLADETYGYVDENNNVELYGNTTIKVEAWDACGNRVYNEYEVTDIVGPEFSINGNPEVWVNSDVELEISSNAKLTALTLNGKNILGDNKYKVNTVITEYGNYTFEATDIYNNTSEQTIEVKIDKSAPEITDVKIEDGKIVITANDIDKTLNKELSGLAEYAITDTTEVPVEWSKSNVINVTKDQNFFVWAKDNAGNITTKEEIVVRDITAPELTITTDVKLDKWINTDIKVDVKSNEELISLVLKYKEIVEQEGQMTEVEKEEDILETRTYTITTNGDYEVVGTDKSGNETKETIKVEKIDKDLPVISEVVVAGESITITATDEISGVKEYAISKVTEEPTEWSKSNVIKTTEDGTYYVWVKDKAGNISQATNTIVVDTKAPTVTFNYLSQTITVGMPIEVNITTDENAIISYSWDKENWVDSTELLTSLKVSEKSTTVGKYTLYVKAKDESGNESKVQSLEFNVTTMEEIKQPDIVFEDISTIQVNGVRYVKVSPNVTTEYLTNRMNKEALCGKTPEYTKLTEDGKLRTGSEIAINGSTKYIVVVKGDVNSDGGIDFIKDIIRANNFRLGIIDLSIPQILAADVNDNGKIEFIQDIIAINNYRLGLIKSL